MKQFANPKTIFRFLRHILQVLYGAVAPRLVSRTVLCSGIISVIILAGCQKASDSTVPDDNYPHPGLPGGVSSVQEAQVKTISKAISLTEETSITLSNTTVTIPAGAVRVAATVSLTSYGGVFINSSTVSIKSEPVILHIFDATGTDIPRTSIYKDLAVQIDSDMKVTPTKLSVLFHENGGLSTAEKTGVAQATLSPLLTATSGGKYRASFKIRPPRIAMTMVEAGGTLPTGFGTFIFPPVNVTEFKGVATSPASVNLTWKADALVDKQFAVVVAASGATMGECSSDHVITSTFDEASGMHSYAVTGLVDGRTYDFKVCSGSFRDPADYSEGVTISVATPARALATLTGAPSVASNVSALDVTVGGANVVDYKYALLNNAANCSSATYSSAWIPIATKITNSVPASGTMILCVLGRIDETNEQLLPTTASWTVDRTPPVFTSIDWVNDAIDGYINNVEKTGSLDLVGNLSASGYDSAAYILVTNSTTCSGPLAYAATLPKSSSVAVVVEGLAFKVCVRLTDQAGNITYGSTAGTITPDFTPPVFSALNLANSVSDGFLNDAEKSLSFDLVSGVSASGHDPPLTTYVTVLASVTCDGALTYRASIPQNSGVPADGVYKVCTKLLDAAGNPTYGASASFTRKTTLPSFSALSLGTNVLDGYLSMSEATIANPLATGLAGSNYDSASYTVVTAATNCDGSLSYGSMPLNNSAAIDSHNTAYKVCVKLTDLAGNPPAFGATSSFTALIAAPTCGGVPLSGDAADAYINSVEHQNATAIVGSVTASSASVVTTNYSVILANATCDGGHTFSSGVPQANSSAMDNNGNYKVCVQVADAVSQFGYCSSLSFTVVNSPITFTSIDLTAIALDGYLNIAEHGTSDPLVEHLVAANYDTVKYAVAGDATTCNGSLTYGLAIPLANDAAIANDGAGYKICVELSDVAGNPKVYGSSASFVLDITAPVFTSLGLANDAVDGWINIAEKANTTSIVGAVVGTGYTGVKYAIAGSATTCDAAVTYAVTVPVSSDNASFATATVSKVCVEIADAAGNKTYGSTSTWTTDYVAPTFTSVTLGSFTSDGYINNTEKSSTGNLVVSVSASGQSVTAYATVLSSVTCDGALTYSTSLPKYNVLSTGSDGTYKVCVKLTDAALNPTYGASSTFIRDTLGPTFTSLARGTDVADGYLSIADKALTNPLATSLVGANYDAAAYVVVTAATTCNSSLTYGTMPLDNAAAVSSNGGSYKVCVKLTDVANNTPAYGATSNFVALIAAPTCTSIPLANDALDGYLNSTEHANISAVVGAVTGASATVSSTNYSVIASNATCGGTQTFGSGVPLSNNSAFDTSGAYKVCVRVADAVSQYGYCESSTITVTNTSIVFTSIDRAAIAADGFISSSDHGSSSPLVTNLVGSNYDTAKYGLVTGATTCDAAVTFAASVPSSDDASISSDGETYKVCVELSDAAGNPKAYGSSATFTYDNSAPVFTSISLANAAADSYLNQAESSLTTDVAGSLVATGYGTVNYALVTSGTTCGLPLTWVSSVPKANDSLFTTNEAYKVCVQLIDLAGNTAYGASANITFDNVAPVFTSVDLANGASDTYMSATDATSGLAMVQSLTGSGYDVSQYKLVLSSATCSVQTGFAGTSPIGTDFATLNGDYKVCVKLADNAGNVTYGASATIHVDTTPPAFTSISLANDATDGYINAAETSHSLDLATTASVSGQDSVHYALVDANTACSSASAWSVAIPKSNSADFGGDGSYKICVKASDTAGNSDAFGSSAAFSLDKTAPVFTSLALGGDAADAYLSQIERTHSTSIVGALTASGQSSSTYKVVASSTACDAQLTYGTSINASSSDITGDGNYKICTKLVDVAGNASYGASSAFEVDTVPPVFTSLTLGAAVIDGYLNSSEHAASTSLGGALTASGQTTTSYAVVSSGTTCNAAVTYGGMPNTDDGSLTGGSIFKLCADLTDNAGNHTYGASGSFTADYAQPTISSVTLAAIVADGYLTLADKTADSDTVTAVSASGHDALSYAVASSGTTCDGSLTYLATIPKTNHSDFNADGSWKICVRASDSAGNTDAYRGSAAFTRDVVLPSSSITTSGTLTPSSTVGTTTTIAGTSSDGTTGVSSVGISVQEGTGGCFNSNTHDFSASCPNWLSVTGTSNWTRSFDDSDFLRGITYTISSRATDGAGQVQTAFGSSTFTWSVAEAGNAWNRDMTFDSASGDDKALAGAVDASGNLYVVGYHSGSDKNWLIKKISNRGIEDTTNWNKDIGDTGVDEIARSVAVDSSGNVYVVGSRWNGSDWDWMIKKFNSSGVEDTANWDMLIDSGNGNDEAYGVVTDSSSNVYVVGYGKNLATSSTSEDIWVKKFSSGGVLSCEQKLDEGGANLSDRALAVAANNSSSKIYIAGYRTTTGPDQQMVVKRLRMSDCSIEATATGNSSGTLDLARAIQIDSSGNVFVSGTTSSTDKDWWIRKYSAALALSTEVSTTVAGNHESNAIAVDSNGKVYVGGYNTGSTEDLWLRQFSSSLVENTATWNLIIDGVGQSNDQVTALVMSAGTGDTNNIYMIGWSTNLVGASSGADWWIRKYAGP